MLSNMSKKLVLGLLRFLRSNPSGGVEQEKDRFNILLVKQSERLGNIVLLNSAINAVKTEFPSARIDLLLPDKFSSLMDDNRINRVIDVQKRAYIVRPWRLISLIRTLRASAYDLAIDCSDVNSHSLTGAVYALLSGASRTAGWKTGQDSLFDIEIPRYGETIHASEMYLRLFSGIFDRPMQGGPYFPDTRSDSGSKKPLIGINCGGRDSKRWPPENFIELGRKFSNKGISFEYILGPDEEKTRSYFENNLPEHGRLLPLTPISELKALFRRYTLFVSSDTGPMHLAWSLRIPTLAIFVDSELEKFKPIAPGSVALDARDGIEVETVFDHSMKIVQAGEVPA